MSLDAAWQALDRDDFRAAERAAQEKLARDPGDAEALYLLGSTWLFEGRPREAIAPLAEALRKGPRRGIGFRLGHCHLALGDFAAAEAALAREAAAYPESANAQNALGIALVNQGRQEAAAAAFLAAARIDPRHPEASANAGNALRVLGRHEEAIPHLQRAVELRPDLADSHYLLGALLQWLQRHDEAIPCFHAALAAAPRQPYALSSLVASEIALCRWQDAAPHIAALRAQALAGAVPEQPFTLLAVSPSPAEHRQCAELHVRNTLRGNAAAAPPAPRPASGGARSRIRLAYFSTDYREHATAWLTARLFELHDRKSFELVGMSYGEDDASAMRRRLAKAFDRFVDLAQQSDEQAARLLREMQIDIAVDLKGHTSGARLALLAARPAPVQAAYLGYPGTLGAPFIDYVVADRIVIPEADERFYTERVVTLPDSYQVNDATRPIGRTPSRKEMHLPEGAVVFCCFNSNYKITPEVFEVWMRLLEGVPGAVLWLIEDNAGARRNLQAAAAARGVEPSRLVFAPKVKQEDHLARQRLADLFLDTLPCNAHTTASDALWAGLPVLTCLGETFAARVAASVLTSVGLPELITQNLADYEALALKLARQPEQLISLKNKLQENRLTHPLFDTARLCRHLETAYRRMWEIHQRGEPPRAFSVPASSK